MPLYALPPRFNDPVKKTNQPGFGDLLTMDARPMANESARQQLPVVQGEVDRLESSIQQRAQYPRGSVTNARGQTMGVQDALGLLERPRVQFNGATIGSDWGNNPANDFGNPMSRVRQVYEPGLTNQERQRRMQRFEGYDQAAAVREGLLGQERVKGQSAVDAAQATAQGGIEQARIKGQSDVAAALAGQADTNRDGVIDPKERLALAEKWAKLDQARLMDPLDGSQAPQQRPALPGEEAFAKMIQEELAKGQVRENPTNVDGFDSAGVFPDMNAQPPRGRVTQLPRENQAVDAPRGIQNSARPTPAYVDRLRQLRNDPNAIAAFEQRFGRGSAAQYLN